MKFAVETWDPAYGSATETLDLESSSEVVDVDVEAGPEAWAPITPGDLEAPDGLAFVDGIRRIDARVWIEHDGVSRPGVCATVAAGAVRCVGGCAEIVDSLVSRAVYAVPEGAGPIVTKCGTYQLIACVDSTPEQIYLAIHGEMTELERRASLAASDVELLILDGPLRGRAIDNAVGYVKTQHVHYLPADLQPVLGQLAVGDRTPLFLIGGRQTRYSWYLRLPGVRIHPMSGVVRCEVPGTGDAATAAERASVITSTLQRFASEAHKDGRAPQNLYPIAGLEQGLRRRLGDALLMERALRVASRDAAA